MDAIRVAAGRAFATLWVGALVFLVLAQPAHALLESSAIAWIAQLAGAALLAATFALRGGILRHCERFAAFLVRSRGLRAVVRSVAAEALALPQPTSSDATEAAATQADSAAPPVTGGATSQWTTGSPASSAGAAGTSLRTAASAPQRPSPPFPPTTA